VVGGNPFAEVGMAKCPDEYICDMADVVWTDSATHFFERGWKWNSTHYFKRKEAYCHHYNDMAAEMNPGRRCNVDS
jgi:hypothetical protein